MAKGFASDDLNKFGPFGRYNEVTIVSTGTTIFTGSQLGAAAIIVSHSSASPNGKITLARGGHEMPLSAFNEGELYEVGAFSVTVDAADTIVYVLKR